jgi:hypothetical protein
MQRTNALNVVKAMSRLKVLARHARERQEQQAAADALLQENGQCTPYGARSPGPTGRVVAAGTTCHIILVAAVGEATAFSTPCQLINTRFVQFSTICELITALVVMSTPANACNASWLSSSRPDGHP